MIRSFTILFLVVVICSCSSSSKLIAPVIKPEIPIDILSKKGIAAYSPKYKQYYFKFLTYLFYNKDDAYNSFEGDFVNVNHVKMSNLNIMAGYWSSYQQHKTSLVVLLTMTETSTFPLNELPITVISSKHGKFTTQTLNGNKFNDIQQRTLFIKKLILENEYDIINKVYDDVITITVGEQQYTFLNPELELD